MANTIKDVARKARVSVATVSRVLNSPELFREETRQKVLTAIETLGYRPNFTAQRMRNNEIKNIGIIVPDISDMFYTYSGFINGIVAKVNEADCHLSVCCSKVNLKKEREYIKYLHDSSVDGLIIIKPRISGPDINTIPDAKRCVVVFGIDLHHDNIQSVIVDNKSGGYEAVTHFLSHRATKIAYIGGIAEEQDYDHWDILEGYRKAMAENGLEIKEGYIEQGYYSEEGGQYAFGKLMNLSEPPEAIICANDKTAMGVLKAARLSGVRVPTDLKLIAFDNTTLCQYTSPTLTSFDKSTYKIGALLFDMLIANLKRRETEIQNDLQVIIPKLVLRESCGCHKDLNFGKNLPEVLSSNRIVVNDNTIGTGNYQFDYVGIWNYSSEPEAYQEDNHWSINSNSYCRFRFNGTQFQLYAALDPRHGIAGISIDGGEEVFIDFFGDKRQDNVLVYTSPELAPGEHLFALRVTGLKNPNSNNISINIDRAEIIL